MVVYQKKPVRIEAELFDGSKEAADRICDWTEGSDTPARYDAESGCLLIATLEGTHIASPGDFVICGVAGEFYPCKPDIFQATYDLVRGA